MCYNKYCNAYQYLYWADQVCLRRTGNNLTGDQASKLKGPQWIAMHEYAGLTEGWVWNEWCPRRDSNPRTWLRRPVLYPLSYGGLGRQHSTGPSTVQISHDILSLWGFGGRC